MSHPAFDPLGCVAWILALGTMVMAMMIDPPPHRSMRKWDKPKAKEADRPPAPRQVGCVFGSRWDIDHWQEKAEELDRNDEL